jgi:hypothetical protein
MATFPVKSKHFTGLPPIVLQGQNALSVSWQVISPMLLVLTLVLLNLIKHGAVIGPEIT